MNHIKQLRGSVFQTDFIQALGVPHIDAPMLSRMEQGKCNPIPADAQKIADKLGKPLTDVWDADDLDYGVGRAQAENSSHALANGSEGRKKDLRSKVTVRKCFRISKSTDAWFTKDKLQATGYMSYQSWFDACVRRFKGEYAVTCKKKAASATAIASAARK